MLTHKALSDPMPRDRYGIPSTVRNLSEAVGIEVGPPHPDKSKVHVRWVDPSFQPNYVTDPKSVDLVHLTGDIEDRPYKPEYLNIARDYTAAHPAPQPA